MTLDVYSGGPFDDDLDGVAEQSNRRCPLSGTREKAARLPRKTVLINT